MFERFDIVGLTNRNPKPITDMSSVVYVSEGANSPKGVLEHKKKFEKKRELIYTRKRAFMPEYIKKFFDNYKDDVMKLEQVYDLPADAVLAHLACETNYGRSVLRVYDSKTETKVFSNNLFNIKASKKWRDSGKRHGYLLVWEDTKIKDGKRQADEYEKEIFRIYGTRYDAMKDYADLIINKDRYNKVEEASTVENYAKELLRCGYFTDAKGDEKIISIAKTNWKCV